MKIAIMQPYLFPYIGYFQLIAAVDIFVVYDDVQFIKRGWINRNYFLVNDQPHLFTFGVKGGSSLLRINERYFAENQDHQIMTFLKLLRSSYAAAPCFEDVYKLVNDIMSFQDSNIARKIEYSLIRLCQYLQIPTRFEASSRLKIAAGERGQDRIIAICKSLEAQQYINAIGGKDLYSEEAFLRENLALSFLQPLPISYAQFGSEFVPNLSMIDVMMFNSVPSVQNLLTAFKLI